MEGDPEAAAALPEDALAEILRRVPPRGRATSRCVCKAWRATVDGRRLLRPDLLPHSVRGIFLAYSERNYPAFLAHPSTEPDIFRELNFHRLPGQWNPAHILGHCNGLLLYGDMAGLHVANPATRWRASLPRPPPSRPGRFDGPPHLVFDPTETESPLHYEVLIVPESSCLVERGEWPPSTWVMCVFSSRTGQWEERSFVREGEAAGMASDEAMQISYIFSQKCSAYWQGALFVQCNGGLTVMRISLSDNKYRVIKMPTDIGETEYYDLYLGQSKEELCCASVHDCCKLRVWILDNGSDGTMEWVLKHHIDIYHSVSPVPMRFEEENGGPWILEDAESGQLNIQDVNKDGDGSRTALVRSTAEWDSDNDDIVDNETEVAQSFFGYIDVLGFHPYKDVIYLNLSLRAAVAYHLNTSTVQVLGKVRPDGYCGDPPSLTSSFLYTPCLIADFPENKLEAHVEG